MTWRVVLFAVVFSVLVNVVCVRFDNSRNRYLWRFCTH